MAADLECDARELELDLGDPDALWDLVGHSVAPVARSLAQRPEHERARVENEVVRLVRDAAADSGTFSARYLEIVARVAAV